MQNQPAQSPAPPVLPPHSPISSLQPVDSPSDPEKKKPKKFIFIILIIFTIALGATGGVFGYQYVQKQKLFQTQPSPTPVVQQPSPSPDPTEGWETYTNETFRFSLQYPQDVKLTDSFKYSEDEIILSVQNAPIDEITDFTFNYTKATALSDKISLEKGIFGIHLQGLKESEEVVKISDNIYAKVFTILQELEACNVQFIRKAIFYYKDNQIILTLSAPKEKIISENKEYFSTNQANCGLSNIWPINDDSPQRFYQALKGNKTSNLSQYWFNTFDQILSTFKFIDETFLKTYSIDLYDLQFQAPTGFTLKETNRRPEPSGPEVDKRGHDCVDYILSSTDKNLVMNFKPVCGFADGGAQLWPEDAVIVKEFEIDYPKYIIRFFNSEISGYEYSYASGEVEQGTPKERMYSFPPILSFEKDGEESDLLFVYINASYNGSEKSKEKYLKIADNIVASLKRK